jgi:hypothetical protein
MPVERIESYKTGSGRIFENKREALLVEAGNLYREVVDLGDLKVGSFKLFYDLADTLRELELINKSAQNAKP